MLLLLKKHKFEHKVIGLFADNYNTNLGGVKKGEMKTLCSQSKKSSTKKFWVLVVLHMSYTVVYK
jgi:hypothetical protein